MKYKLFKGNKASSNNQIYISSGLHYYLTGHDPFIMSSMLSIRRESNDVLRDVSALIEELNVSYKATILTTKTGTVVGLVSDRDRVGIGYEWMIHKARKSKGKSDGYRTVLMGVNLYTKLYNKDEWWTEVSKMKKRYSKPFYVQLQDFLSSKQIKYKMQEIEYDREIIKAIELADIQV